MNKPIVFIDTETLGLDPDRHAIWEIGMVLHYPDPGPPSDSEILCQLRLAEEQVAQGDPVGMEIGGFHDRYNPDHADDPAIVCRYLVALTDGCHLAGNVTSFDEERLRRLCLSHGFTPKWHYHLIDVENLAVGYLNGMARGWAEGWADGAGGTPHTSGPQPFTSLPWKSDDLSRLVGVDPDDFDRHTALGDAQWALAIYKAITEVSS